MNDWWGLVWLVVLLAVNGFFVAAEFAVISARRSQIEPAAAAGRRGAKTTIYAMEHATLMLATTQLGITVCSLIILNVSEPAIHHLLEGPLSLTGLSVEMIATVAFILTLVIVSFLHVVFGEMVPKNISFSVPDRAALVLAPPLVFIAKVFKPIIIALNGIANGVLRLCGVEPRSEANSAFTLEEVATIVDQSTRSGVLTDNFGALTAAFEFTEKTVRDIAIGFDELITLPVQASPADVERAVARHGFSRYILIDEMAVPVGYLHVKDIIDLSNVDEPVPETRQRPVFTLTADLELEDVLATMRRMGSHLAAVVDEAGRVGGIVFLEDIIEELVGEVHDATRRQ